MTTDTLNTTTNLNKLLNRQPPAAGAATDIVSPANMDVRPRQKTAEEPLPLHKLPSHIPTLDGIRGLAVLLILFCHGTLRPEVKIASMDHIGGIVDKGILTLAQLAWTGVDMFFVLSGFLITGILYDAKGKPGFFRNFYARRTVRIFPLYYATLILFLVIWPRLPGWMSEGFGALTVDKIWYWLYLSNYAQGVAEQWRQTVHHVLHVTWSLSIEEQFYLCWPLVVFLCTRKTLLKVCVGMFFGSMLLRIVLLACGKEYWAMNFTPCRVDALAVGAAIALIARGPLGINCLIRPAKIIGPFAFACVCAMVVSMYLLGFRRGIGQSPGYVISGTALFAISYGALLVGAIVAAQGTWMNRMFGHPVMRMFGKYSYAIYLFHVPIMVMVAQHIFHPNDLSIGNSKLVSLLIFFAITWPLSVVAALISWNLLEKHFLKLKDYFPMEKKADTATAWQGKDIAKAEPQPVR